MSIIWYDTQYEKELHATEEDQILHFERKQPRDTHPKCIVQVTFMTCFRGDAMLLCSLRLLHPSESFGIALHLSLGSCKQAAVSLARKKHGKVQIKLGKNPGRSYSSSGLAAHL